MRPPRATGEVLARRVQRLGWALVFVALAPLALCIAAAPARAEGRGEARMAARAKRETTLWSAARDGDVARVKALLAAGAAVNESGRLGRTALAWAVQARKAEVIPMLLAAGADPLAGRDEDTALTLCLRKRRRGLLPLLASGLRVTPPKRVREFLGAVVAKGKERPLAVLLSAGFDADTKDVLGWPLLVVAAREGRLAAVRVLLDAGADVHAVKPGAGTALDVAMRRRNLDVVALLTSRGASWARTIPEIRALRPVALAMGADLSVLDWLAGHDALTARDANGRTFLHLAARAGSVEATRLLLARGMPVDVSVRRDGRDTGWTALMLAAAESGVEEIALLVLGGADLNHRSARGYTPLLVAAFYGRAENVRVLKERGAAADVKDDAGMLSPGPMAVEGGYVDAAAIFGLEARPLPLEFQPKPRPVAVTPAAVSAPAAATAPPAPIAPALPGPERRP